MSRWSSLGFFIAVALVFVGWPTDGDARSFRVGMLPNAPAGCNTCHTSGGGTPRNSFGQAVEARVTPGGRDAFWGPELAALDSDGDGVSNGQELGDPDGDGRVDAAIQVTHPGDAASFVQPPPVQPPPVQPPPGGGDGTPAGDGLLRVVSASLGDVALEPDVKNPALPAGAIEAELTFNKPLIYELDDQGQPEFENAEFIALPPSLLDDAQNIAISDDGLTLSATFSLEEDTTYQLIVGDADARSAEEASLFYFGTTELSDAAVSGVGLLPEGMENAVLSEEGGAAVLLDPEAMLAILQGEDGGDEGGVAGKIARMKVAIARQLQQPPPPPGGEPTPFEDGPREGEGDEDEDGLGPLIYATVRIGVIDDLPPAFELDFVPDGEYVLLVTVDVETNGRIASLSGFRGVNFQPERIEDFIQEENLVVVSGGQSVTDLVVDLEEQLEEVFIEETAIDHIDFEEEAFVIPSPEGPVRVDVSGAEFFGPDGEDLEFDDFLPGDVVAIEAGVIDRRHLAASAIYGISRQAPPKVVGRILSVRERDGRGRIDLRGPQFSFDAHTRVVGPFGQAFAPRDLRPGEQLVILARESDEAGRPPQAIEVSVLSAGEPPPPPDSENGLFVGNLANVNFETRRFQLQASFGFNENTQLVGRNDEAILLRDLTEGAKVRVTVQETNAGLPYARKIKLLRGADEVVAERIAEGVFITPDGELPIDRAFGVPLEAELWLRFDVPLTADTQDLVDVFVHRPGDEDDEGEDIPLTTELVDGELKVTMSLQPDTFYEGFAAIEDGNEVFGVFTTATQLPTLEPVSSIPADDGVNVPTTTTLSVTLNNPVGSEGEDVFAHIEVLPLPLSGPIEPEDLRLSQDGTTISVDVDLEPDRTYLAVLVDAFDNGGFRLAHPYKVHFSTGAEIADGKVSGNLVLPPGNVLDPVLRNGIGYVSLLSADIDFENLEGDEADQLATAFDVTTSGAFEIEGVPAGSYIVEGFAFFDAGGEAGEGIGLVGNAKDENGDPRIIEVPEGVAVTGVEVPLGGELELTASKPRPGQGGVGAGRRTVSLEFSEPLQQHRGTLALEAIIDPPVEGFNPREDLHINPDNPRRIEARVNLEPDTDYVMLVFWAQGVSGAELVDVAEIPFSTRENFVGGGISGTVALSNGTVPRGSAILGDLAKERRIAEVKINREGGFHFKNLPPGTYGVFLEIDLPDGRKLRDFLADENGDVRPLVLEEGGSIVDLELSVNLTGAPPAPGEGGQNTGSSLAFDFNGEAGNGGQSAEQVTAGEAFSVAVYAEGVTDLIGYEVVVAFEADKVALKSVQEQSAAEGANILKKDGGLGAFIGRVGEGTATMTAVILGPSAKVAPDGGGLLGVLEFEALSDFSGTTDLTIQTAVLTDIGGASDSLRSDVTATISAVTLTKAIGLTIEPGIITADGSSAATVTAQILDLSGVLQSDDNSTVVTFSTSGGTLASTEVTAVSGVASTTLTSGSAGTLTVTASASGALDQTAKVVAQASTVDIPTGPAGPIALDLDLSAGDQGVRQSSTTPSAGDVVEVDLVAVSGALDAVGVNVELKFDSNALSFKGFSATDLFGSAVPITVPKTGAVQISLAFLGSSASKDAGSIGTVSFAVESGFSTSTSVVLASAEYGTASGATALDIGAGGATVIIGGSSTAGPNPDLNGDGSVGFPDFLIFASAFGTSSGDPGFVAQADLNGDGAIGFPDFLAFASAFGQ